MAIGIHMPTQSAASGDVTTSLMQQLERHAPMYFPDLDVDTTTIRLVRASRRTYSAFYEFEAASSGGSRGIIVKIPFLPVQTADVAEVESSLGARGGADRPRLFGMVNPRDMAQFEFAALTAIEHHIESLSDARLGTIRPLDFWQDPQAVVMEKNEDASLRLVHRAARRFGASRASIPYCPDAAIENAAVWLRGFHEMPGLAHTSDRMPTRAAFLEAMKQQVGHLIEQGEDADFLNSVQAFLEKQAHRRLPAELELATSHGDYAPRNLLIGRDNQVAVLDTLARWRAPRLEDVAMFLIGLRAPAAHVVSFGWAYQEAALRRFESHFLTHYFAGAAVPLEAVRLFEGLLLLDRLSAFLQRTRQAKSSRRLYATWRLKTLRRFSYRQFRHMFHELDHIG